MLGERQADTTELSDPHATVLEHLVTNMFLCEFKKRKQIYIKNRNGANTNNDDKAEPIDMYPLELNMFLKQRLHHLQSLSIDFDQEMTEQVPSTRIEYFLKVRVLLKISKIEY